MTNNLQNLFKNNPELGKQFNDLPFPTKKTEEWIYTNPNLLFDGISEFDHNSASTDLSGDILFSNGALVGNNTNLSIREKESNIKTVEATQALQQLAKSYEIIIDSDQESPFLFIKIMKQPLLRTSQDLT